MPPGTQEHLRVCEGCAAFTARLLEQPGRAFDTHAELARIEAAIQSERGFGGWLRSQPTAIRLLLVGAAACASLLMNAWLGARSGHVALSRERALAIAISALLAFAATRESLRPMYERHRPMLRRTLVLLALAGPWLIAMIPLGAGENAAARGDCLPLGLSVAIPLFVLLRALDRGVPAAMNAPWLPVAIAALIANLALLLSCPSAHSAHLLRAHAPVGLLLALSIWIWRGVAGVRTHAN